MVYSALSAVAVISQFTRRKAIKITTAGTSTPAAYQIKVTIAYEPAMQTSFQDIRFNTKNQVYIDYWIESFTASTTATVWLELPNAITDPGSDTIWMYYGNAGVSDGSNIKDTFIFGDDFEDGDYSQYTTFNGVWVESNGILQQTNTGTGVKKIYKDIGITDYILEAKMRPDTFGIDTRMGINGRINTGDIYRVGYSATVMYNNVTKLSIFDDELAWGTPVSTGFTYTAGTWYNLELALIGNAQYAKSWIVGTSRPSSYLVTQAYTTHTTETNIGFYAGYSSAMSFDDVRVRKYIAIEPTATLGTEQHQRRVPTFL